MTHGYRTLQDWNQWLTQQFLGKSLIESERLALSGLLQRCLGKHVCLVGVPAQFSLLMATTIPCHSLLGPQIHHEKNINYIETDFIELPILTGSIDLVMLPHTLEFIDNPRQLLTEACRIVKPEGLIVICGFNPYSFWGLKKRLARHKTSPWSHHHMQPYKIKHWLQLADFQLEQEKTALFRPPIAHQKIYQRLFFLEKLGHKCFPLLGGIYMILARAKVIPLTPIRMKWKQELNAIPIPTTTSNLMPYQNIDD